MNGEQNLQNEISDGKPEAPVGGAIEHMHTVQQMETPKGTLGVFELPCGYLDPHTQELFREVQVREITGHEEDMLSSQQVPSAQKVSTLLAGCVERIGTVTDKGLISGMVQDLVIGDRVFLIFAIRRVTLGDDLPVREKCPDCGVTTLFMVDLAEDLNPKEMKNPRKRVYDVQLPSGTTARFRVPTGADEANFNKIIKRQKHKADGPSQSLLMRLELLGGEKPTLKMVKSLGMRDRQFLRNEFEEVEGGIDTTLELECPSCGSEWEKDLDLSAANFFFPGGRRKR